MPYLIVNINHESRQENIQRSLNRTLAEFLKHPCFITYTTFISFITFTTYITFYFLYFLLCRSNMEWTEDHDHSLGQEILTLECFKAKKESIGRGQIWDQIASNLKSLEIPRFKVTKRSVRERYTLLIEKLKKKLKEEEKASGIDTDMNDVEKTLEEILEKEADAENTPATDKKRVDNVKAVKMRNRAMESMRTTQKRNQGDEDKDVEIAPKPKDKKEWWGHSGIPT